jgi:hypothetical protein
MPPGHVDLSVLWVPIMPETSKLGPAMEEAGTRLGRALGEGIGDRHGSARTRQCIVALS